MATSEADAPHGGRQSQGRGQTASGKRMSGCLTPCSASPQALRRADQVESAEGDVKRDWYAPIVADAEAGFGGVLNAYELMKARALCPELVALNPS